MEQYNKIMYVMLNYENCEQLEYTKPQYIQLIIIIYIYIYIYGFGGLGVACWPIVPKFAGLNRPEALGVLGPKNPQHAFLRRGSKAVGPMS